MNGLLKRGGQPPHNFPKTKMKTYEFRNLKLKLGTQPVIVSGYAKYELESLESLGVDDHIVAFLDAKIQDWEIKSRSKKEFQGITKNELEVLEELVIETLNDDGNLVERLSQEEKNS